MNNDYFTNQKTKYFIIIIASKLEFYKCKTSIKILNSHKGSFQHNKNNLYLYDFVPMKNFNSLKYTDRMEKSALKIWHTVERKNVQLRSAQIPVQNLFDLYVLSKSFPFTNTSVMNTI